MIFKVIERHPVGELKPEGSGWRWPSRPGTGRDNPVGLGARDPNLQATLVEEDRKIIDGVLILIKIYEN